MSEVLDIRKSLVVKKGLINNISVYLSELESYAKVIIVSDSIVSSLYLDSMISSLEKTRVNVLYFIFEEGEKSKTLATAIQLYDFLSENSVTRGDVMIALGGGVVGDVVGFVASTYMRGIDLIQVPTTLLAQIDSSIGGKNALNTNKGKNIVGTFYQPKKILVDPNVLQTLPGSELANGFSEMVKYGAICDQDLFYQLSNCGFSEDMILRCAKVKIKFVEEDERDRSFRMLLNFGHTIGHAIELLSNYSISHGQAVAIGMVMITRMSEFCGITEPGTVQKIIGTLQNLSLPYETNIPLSSIRDTIFLDKKVFRNHINIAVLKRIGKAELIKLSLNDLSEFMRC